MSYLHNLFRGDSNPRVHRVGKCVCTLLQSFQNRRNSKPLLNFPPHLAQLSERLVPGHETRVLLLNWGFASFILFAVFQSKWPGEFLCSRLDGITASGAAALVSGGPMPITDHYRPLTWARARGSRRIYSKLYLDISGRAGVAWLPAHDLG